MTNVDHYARIVKEKAILRSLIYSASVIQEQALAAGDDADVILDRAESSIFQLAEDRVKVGLIGVKDLVKTDSSAWKKSSARGAGLRGSRPAIRARQRDGGVAAVGAGDSGGAAFDGEDGAGAEHRRKRGAAESRAGGVFSLEMSKESLLLRLLASHARVDAHKFRTGHMNRDDWGKVTAALDEPGRRADLD